MARSSALWRPLGLRFDAAADLQQHADHIVGHFHNADVDKACYQGVADRGGMHPHLAGALVSGPPLQGLEDSERDGGKRLRWHARQWRRGFRAWGPPAAEALPQARTAPL
jgi:hypothetical protein